MYSFMTLLTSCDNPNILQLAYSSIEHDYGHKKNIDLVSYFILIVASLMASETGEGMKQKL
jgi:hypothetical protein